MSAVLYRPDIQGLRAVAVLAVMLFHGNPAWLPGGGDEAEEADEEDASAPIVAAPVVEVRAPIPPLRRV